jgi:uncharacterized membrane-anchored protein YitT (DUF2179 family)
MFRTINFNFLLNSLRNDEELKEHYIIREVWLPINEGQSDVKIIYPVSPSDEIKELENLIKKIDRNPQYNGTQLVKDWKNLVRSLKLRKLDKLLF